MFELKTIARLFQRVRRRPELWAGAIAALLFLSALPAPARAQGTNTYGGSTVIHSGFIGLVPGQALSVTVPNFYFQDGGKVRFVKHSLKVYEIESSGVTETNSTLIYSGESGGINEAAHEYGHTFYLNHSHTKAPGDPRTGRVELRVEVESFPPAATEDSSAVVLSPTLELIEPDGRTVLLALLSPAMQRSAESQVTSTNVEGGLQLEMSKSLRRALYNSEEVSVGVVEGQTMRLTIDVSDNAPTSSSGTDAIITGAGAVTHVKVFSASTGALLQSREIASSTAGVYSIDFNRADLREAGDPITGRLQLWIAVNSGSASSEESNTWVHRSTFQVIDNVSGKTTVLAGMKESMETMKKAWKDPS